MQVYYLSLHMVNDISEYLIKTIDKTTIHQSNNTTVTKAITEIPY